MADFFANREKADYIPSKKALRHVEAVLQLLKVFTRDKRYKEIEEDIMEKVEAGGEVSMCDFAERMERQGIEKGIEQGIRVLILDNLEEGKTKEVIIAKLVKGFQLDEETATDYFEKFASTLV